MCAGYAFLGSVPALGERRMELFFVSLAFTAGALAIYNAQWQAMFGAAVSLRQRNDVYAFRNQFMFVIGILAPVICGILMGRCHTADGKLLVLRSFFYSVCCLCFVAGRCNQKIPVEQQEEGKAPAEAGKASSRFFLFLICWRRSQAWGKISIALVFRAGGLFLYHLAA